MKKEMITVRRVDEDILRKFKARAVTERLKIGDALTEAMRESFIIKKVDDYVFQESWQNFCNQKSTNFSFTDCTIISLIKKGGIRNISTFDDDFKKVEGISVIGF